MYCFLGLERRANCFFMDSACLVPWDFDAHEVPRAPAALAHVMCGRWTGRLVDVWTVYWSTDSPRTSPTKPVGVAEYDHDDEFCHLGYTAPLTARSKTAEKALTRALTKLTRRAARIFATKPNLRDCSVRIVPSVLVPKAVCNFSFGKARPWPRSKRRKTERGCPAVATTPTLKTTMAMPAPARVLRRRRRGRHRPHAGIPCRCPYFRCSLPLERRRSALRNVVPPTAVVMRAHSGTYHCAPSEPTSPTRVTVHRGHPREDPDPNRVITTTATFQQRTRSNRAPPTQRPSS